MAANEIDSEENELSIIWDGDYVHIYEKVVDNIREKKF